MELTHITRRCASHLFYSASDSSRSPFSTAASSFRRTTKSMTLRGWQKMSTQQATARAAAVYSLSIGFECDLLLESKSSKSSKACKALAELLWSWISKINQCRDLLTCKVYACESSKEFLWGLFIPLCSLLRPQGLGSGFFRTWQLRIRWIILRTLMRFGTFSHIGCPWK